MKTLFTLLILILCLNLNADAQVEKTLVKSIATETTTSSTDNAVIVLPGKVVVSEWDNKFIRITTNLKVANMSENIVKQLIMVGRYTIVSKINDENNTLSIYMPKMANTVTVKGLVLSELVNFEISAPKGYRLVIKSTENDIAGQSL
jgi:hypothetical protein